MSQKRQNKHEGYMMIDHDKQDSSIGSKRGNSTPHIANNPQKMWMPNQNVDNCQNCLRKFNFMNRRHHCRICEQIYCAKCSNQQMLYINREVQKIRICNNCDHLKKEFNQIKKEKQPILTMNKKDYMDYSGSSSNNDMRLKSKKPVNQMHDISMKKAKDTEKMMRQSNYHRIGPQQTNRSNESQEEEVEEAPMTFENKLKTVKNESGLDAARKVFNQQQELMRNQYIQRQEEEDQEGDQISRSFSRSKTSRRMQSIKGIQPNSLNRSQNHKVGTPELSQIDEKMYEQTFDDLMQNSLYEYMADIRERVIKEFELDHSKWSQILSQFVLKAIQTVRPWSFKCGDNIDITKYVKIQLIQYKDTSKCKYVNGVVIKKSIAHNRMKKEISNPKILLLSNSLGIQKDEEDFLDIETEIKQEDSFINIVMRKIEMVNPNLIIVQNDASIKAIEALVQKNITLITNVKPSVMQRLGRLTQTINCPSAVFLDEQFNTGKCEKFFMETLPQFEMKRSGKIENITHLIQLDGCLPFLGCTIILSDRDMNELKIVKHALKKMLRLSRQIILENEYLQFLNLQMIPNFKEDPRKTPFLHHKHMERDFLIFKEVSFSRRNIITNIEEEEEHEDPQGNKVENNPATNQNEKEVQSRIQMICQAPTIKRVHFYSEEHNDLSLVCKLRELCKSSIKKCEGCQQYNLYHTHHFYHKSGYVQMSIRFSQRVEQDPGSYRTKIDIQKSDDKPIMLQCQCELCKYNVFVEEQLTKQLQEISFYSFLEQFFYNNEGVQLTPDEEEMDQKCPHAFHSSSKMVFMIGILRIEFQYHPVNIYQLDLTCFKDMEGPLSKKEIQDKFNAKKVLLMDQMAQTFDFLTKSSCDLKEWLTSIFNIDQLQNASYLLAKTILQNVVKYLENLDQNMRNYRVQAQDTLLYYQAENEFLINKIHKSITNRVSDYIFILIVIYQQIFDEFISNFNLNQKNKDTKKYTKREQIMKVSKVTNDLLNKQHNLRRDTEMKFDQNNNQSIIRNDTQIDMELPLEQFEDKQASNINTDLVDFEERLKKCQYIKDLMVMSPSIPNGFDLNCTTIDVDDFSTIICQALLSNDHIMGLKAQGYMNLESRLEKHRHDYKKNQPDSAARGKEKLNTSVEYEDKVSMQKEMYENVLVFKENQDVLNKDISQKEIETELLRLNPFHFLINFNTYKGPFNNQMIMTKDRTNNDPIKVDRKILQKSSTLDVLDKIGQSDLDQQFYTNLNNQIIHQIFKFKNSRELKKGDQNENQHKEVTMQEKYAVHALFYPKTDIEVKVYFPSHFQALRKLYCGSFNDQNEQLFKSSFWADNSGGKSQSKFYKSYNEKYVMKVINSNEMRMFCEFAQPYFEYMCRSFNQKCPSCIGKILGAYKLNIRIAPDKKAKSYYVVLMENLTLGMNPRGLNLSKYDLKGSMSRRYVVVTSKDSTRLDTNFLEDNNSKPVCMNYTMHRLMEIAIHNDTSFLSRHEKIDYSFLVWIDHDLKLIRVGIIDYIQYYTFTKQLEHQVKKAWNQGKNPTILDPVPYKQRFKLAMNNYFMSILEDKPIEEFHVLVEKQLKMKREAEEKQLKMKKESEVSK